MDKHILGGALIERGEITQVRDDGYIIRSYSRYPVMTNPLKSIAADIFRVGDTVYYFMFDDGSGLILSRFTAMT